MFDSNLKPVGLYVEQGQELVHANTKPGKGNFYMKPNGIFYISAGNAAIAETQAFLCAFSARGLFMGNRGGRFHTDAKTLTTRRCAYEDVLNACTGATSMSCPMAHLLHSMERPAPFVAARSYAGRRMVTMLASRGRAASPSTCSPRQR
jgi:hypothetical protein